MGRALPPPGFTPELTPKQMLETRRVRREIHDRLPEGISGELVQSARAFAPIAAKQSLNYFGVEPHRNRCQNGGAKVGFIRTIRAAGSNGIADIICGRRK